LIKTEAKISYGGETYILRIKELSITGRWRMNSLEGTFHLTKEKLVIRLTAGAILYAVLEMMKHRRMEYVDIMKQLSRELGIAVEIQGPLGVRIMKA